MQTSTKTLENIVSKERIVNPVACLRGLGCCNVSPMFCSTSEAAIDDIMMMFFRYEIASREKIQYVLH